ncbi:MAG: hypothetical protein HC880_19065 [Bacteroidia bacterium]|nr:hypothetical protein [Bacteroidia bacterium]
MKKSNFLRIVLCALMLAGGITAYAQEILKREKIYTLNANEVVAYEENSLGLYQDELGYIVVTADVKQFSRSYHIKGKTYGPFDRRLVEKPVFNISTWGFIDSKEETSYVYFNGEEIGVHKDPLYPVGLKVAKSSWAYVLIDQLEGSTRVIINRKEYGPYASLQNYFLSDDGSRWAIIYSDEPENFYVLFNNGKRIGPYREVINFEFLGGKADRWVLTVEMPDMVPKVVNEREIKQFTVVTNTGEVGTFEEELPGSQAYDFKELVVKGENYGQTVVRDQKIFFLANDEVYGPYKNIPQAIDMGEEYNKFNYIDPATKTLHFKGDGIFSVNVRDYYVSQSRKSVAVIKSAGASRDSLYMNDKYFQGVYDKILYLKFSPDSEEWALLTNNGNGTYTLHFHDGRQFGPYTADTAKGTPPVLLGRNAKNWAFYYADAKTGKTRLIVNNADRQEDILGDIALVREDGQEYFSWFSLDDRTVYLNKLLLE